MSIVAPVLFEQMLRFSCSPRLVPDHGDPGPLVSLYRRECGVSARVYLGSNLSIRLGFAEMWPLRG